MKSLSSLLDEEFDDCQEEKSEKREVKCEECGGFERMEIDNEILCANCHNVFSNITDRYQVSGDDKDTKVYSGITNPLCPQMSTRSFMNGGKVKSIIKKIHTWSIPHKEKVNVETFKIYTKYLTIHYKIFAAENHAKKYNISEILGLDEKNTFNPENLDHMTKLNYYLSDNGLTYRKPDEKIMTEAALLFGKLNSVKVSRRPIRIGVIAVCLGYVFKNNYIVCPEKELAKIFFINSKTVSKGNNRINKLIKKYRELEKLVNRWPITLDDYVVNLKRTFPSLSDEDVEIVRAKIDRIRGLKIVNVKVSTSILAGILSNCIKTYGFKITPEEILARLYCSKSVRTTCKTLLEPYFYN